MKKSIYTLFILAFCLTSMQASVSGRIKARFLKIFPKYISWPEQSVGDEFDFIILSESDTIYYELKDLMDRNYLVNDKPLKIQRLTSIDEIKSCEMIFVSNEEKYNVETIQSKFPKNVLIITDHYSKGIENTMIDFQKVDKKLKFELNIPMIKESGLITNENLRAVASKVIE